MIDSKSEQQMFDTMRNKLYAAVISDVLDSLSVREQAMRADICPIYPGAVVVGRASTAVSAEVFETVDDPYRGEIETVDSLKANDVLVLCASRSTRTCLWGELLSTAARARGARGVVIDDRLLLPSGRSGP